MTSMPFSVSLLFPPHFPLFLLPFFLPACSRHFLLSQTPPYPVITPPHIASTVRCHACSLHLQMSKGRHPRVTPSTGHTTLGPISSDPSRLSSFLGTDLLLTGLSYSSRLTPLSLWLSELQKYNVSCVPSRARCFTIFQKLMSVKTNT